MASEITSPTGVVYRKVGKIAPSRAAVLVQERATNVAWDGCACGGFCGYDWMSDDQLSRLREAGNPRIKLTKTTPSSGLYEYGDGDQALVLAVGDVMWAGLLADRLRP